MYHRCAVADIHEIIWAATFAVIRTYMEMTNIVYSKKKEMNTVQLFFCSVNRDDREQESKKSHTTYEKRLL